VGLPFFIRLQTAALQKRAQKKASGKMHKYKLLSKKGEGTFSEVLKAQTIKGSKMLAIKCMKNNFKSIDQVNNLREIQALKRLSPHPGVIKLYEVLYDQPTGRLALVFELMEMNIYELIRGKRTYLPMDTTKNYMYQLMKSMDHMHRNGIFHRDIKPENILVSGNTLKVADFGSCRGIYSKQPYTEYISTRWYRAPECLLTDGFYGYKMDMWGVGCVMFEVLALFPLFPGTNELDQVERIHNILGTPGPDILNKFQKYATHMEFNFTEKIGTGIRKMIPHVDETCLDLIVKLLAYDPEDRLSARQALRHPYFAEIRKAEKQAEKVAVKATNERKKDLPQSPATPDIESSRGMHKHDRGKKELPSKIPKYVSKDNHKNKLPHLYSDIGKQHPPPFASKGEASYPSVKAHYSKNINNQEVRKPNYSTTKSSVRTQHTKKVYGHSKYKSSAYPNVTTTKRRIEGILIPMGKKETSKIALKKTDIFEKSINYGGSKDKYTSPYSQKYISHQRVLE